MTSDEAREIIISGIDYAAFRETASSLHDSDKNLLFGAEHYDSGRPVYDPSPWPGKDFEQKMAMLPSWARGLNHSVRAFAEAERLLEDEESVIGRIIRRSRESAR